MHVNAEGEDTGAERAEVHRLAAYLDALLNRLRDAKILSRDDLNAIEQAVAEQTGSAPRLW